MLPLNHILALGFLPSITNATVRALVESGASLYEIRNASPTRLARMGLKRNALQILHSDVTRCLDIADDQMLRAKKHGAAIVSYWDTSYPASLRQIYSPPTVLYVNGELNQDDDKSIAIVGTRMSTVYGRLSCEKYAAFFASAGVTVVSGLARGIDTYAHSESMKNRGRTIAVIASGLDEISPHSADQLSHSIAGNGAVITEYPFGTKALPSYFPQRNRIISGMSVATVVIESDERGGAMITAQFALDQNRDVFAVPGSVSSPKSRGTNLLIRTDRARLTQTPEDVLEACGLRIALPNQASAAKAPMVELTVFEQRVYDALDHEPKHIDALCEETTLAPSDILVSLLTLEFKGLVRQMAGKMFLLTA